MNIREHWWKWPRTCPRAMANNESRRTTADFRADLRLMSAITSQRRFRNCAHQGPALLASVGRCRPPLSRRFGRQRIREEVRAEAQNPGGESNGGKERRNGRHRGGEGEGRAWRVGEKGGEKGDEVSQVRPGPFLRGPRPPSPDATMGGLPPQGAVDAPYDLHACSCGQSPVVCQQARQDI